MVKLTVEAEYIALANATYRALKVYNLLLHIVGYDNIKIPIEFYSDSQGAIAEAQKDHSVHMKHTVHIDMAYHFF